MGIKAVTRQVNDVTVVDLSGQIKLGDGSAELRETVKDLLSKGYKRILINLADVGYIDSAGVGELVSAYTSARNQGGDLKLLNLTRKIREVLHITKLATVFDVQDDERTALAAFSR